MKHLYFVRHGLSVMNKRGIYSGRTDTPLASEGINQAEAAGAVASELLIDCIVTSPMQRAQQTAHIIAVSIGQPLDEILVSDLFMERDFGSLEGTEYQPHKDPEGHPGVESGDDILKRAQAGLVYLQSLPCDNILLVSHGAIGRALRHLLNPETPFHETKRFENAQIEQLL